MQASIQEPQTHSSVHDLQFDYYGKKLAVASSDGIIRIYSLMEDDSMILSAELKGHEAAVWKVCWSSPKFEGGLLASCSYDRTVIIWKQAANKTWEKLYSYHGHELSVSSVAFAPHQYGLVLACGSADGAISIIRYKEGCWNIHRLMGHHMGVNAVAWAPYHEEEKLLMAASAYAHAPGMRLASGGCDELIKIWRYDEALGDFLCEDVLKGHKGWVRCLAWSTLPGSRAGIISSGSADKSVLLWKSPALSKPFQPSPLCSFNDEVWDVCWSTTGENSHPALAVTTGDGQTTLWKAKIDNSSLTRRAEMVWEEMTPSTTPDSESIPSSLLFG